MKLNLFFSIGCIVLVSCNISNSKGSGNKAQHDSKVDQVASSKPKMEAIAFEYATKAIIEKDSTVFLFANMKRDHRIFGYEQPDTSSRKMFLLSIFTDEVEGNPFGCPFGAYYETSKMEDMALVFDSSIGEF
ncbi:MAG: hypothetical protein GC192_12385 [Bacteroidetes bacterium]|nr:hypothetical protein [Bacteroidota bacterium]